MQHSEENHIESLTKNIFLLTLGSLAAYVAAVILFVL